MRQKTLPCRASTIIENSEGAVQSIQSKMDGEMSIFVGESANDLTNGVVLHLNKETSVLSLSGLESFSLAEMQLEDGMKLKVFYGPVMTLSLPPQSTAQLLIIDTAEATEAK